MVDRHLSNVAVFLNQITKEHDMHFNDRDRRHEADERMAADAFAEQDLPLGTPRRGSVPDETWRRCVDIVKADALQRWQVAAKTFETESRERGRQRILDAAERLQREKELADEQLQRDREFISGIWGVRARNDYGPAFDDMPLEQQVRLANEVAENWEVDR